ncbi:MAG: nicotinate-nucleotide diphosphorylase (carboxylating), partial [Eubacterium sp.]
MKINVDEYILNTLKEDITSEDVSTNAVMPEDRQGKADLICKQDGIICGLDIFKRTFELLDSTSRFEVNFKDGDRVHKGDLLGII